MTEGFTPEQLDSMMSKIRKLLERADHPNTPAAEADSCRARAEKIMAKYRIAEQDAIMSGALKNEPVTRAVNVCASDNPFRDDYLHIFGIIMSHCGVMGAYGHDFPGDGTSNYVMHTTGYESDIRFAETMFQQARIIFAGRMEPSVRPGDSDQVNVYNLRSAGITRARVAEMMGWTKAGAKVTRLYEAECKARGEDPALVGRGVSVAVYRESYASGFKNQLWSDLDRARINAGDSGGELVLANREENVKEAFYNQHPSLRPDPSRKTLPGRKQSAASFRKELERMSRPEARMGNAAGKAAAREFDAKTDSKGKRLS